MSGTTSTISLDFDFTFVVCPLSLSPFQAKIFPAMAQCMRNKILYKVLFQKSEPDMTKVSGKYTY